MIMFWVVIVCGVIAGVVRAGATAQQIITEEVYRLNDGKADPWS